MHRFLIIFLLGPTYSLLAQTQFDAENWKLVRSKNGIDYFEKVKEDSIILGCRFQTHFTPKDFIEKLRDVESYTEWISGVDSVRRLSTKTMTDSAFSYQFFIEYWFLKKEGVVDLYLGQKSRNHFISRSFLGNGVKEVPKFDRVDAYRITWDFYQKTDANTIEYTGLLDIPEWVYNLVRPYIIDNVEKTMLTFRSKDVKLTSGD